MKLKRHGITIGSERINDQSFLTLKVIGKLTHEDYKKINPIVDAAMGGVTDPHVKVLFDGSEMEGWELRAAWDDFKLGLRHGNHFSKIAFFGHKKWQELAAGVGSWFVSGEIKYFENIDDALIWLFEE